MPQNHLIHTLQGWCGDDFANVLVDQFPLALGAVVGHDGLDPLFLAKPLLVESVFKVHDGGRVQEVDQLPCRTTTTMTRSHMIGLLRLEK